MNMIQLQRKVQSLRSWNLQGIYTWAHTLTHTYEYIHTCTHSYRQTRTHILARTQMHTHTHMHTCACTHMHRLTGRPQLCFWLDFHANLPLPIDFMWLKMNGISTLQMPNDDLAWFTLKINVVCFEHGVGMLACAINRVDLY